MNREQAEHILDAYVSAKAAADMHGGVYIEDCATSLREVIIDAMVPSSTITLPTKHRWYSSDQDVELHKPNINYTPAVTWVGIDPAYNQTTGGDA